MKIGIIYPKIQIKMEQINLPNKKLINKLSSKTKILFKILVIKISSNNKILDETPVQEINLPHLKIKNQCQICFQEIILSLSQINKFKMLISVKEIILSLSQINKFKILISVKEINLLLTFKKSSNTQIIHFILI